MLDSGRLTSRIFLGPPGVGKTTLAQIFTFSLQRLLQVLSTIQSVVKKAPDAIEKAKPKLFLINLDRFCLSLWTRRVTSPDLSGCINSDKPV
ncbi:MAG: hypothetical protein IPL63_00215 [Saprospiraceae bacterium]|nr:hypothetical protein [Saprospiraceae bacterium]MBK8545859.1 hypothetical protein [Saprospiraceae bacterium]